MANLASDGEIWNEIRQGQEKALSELFFRYSDLLLSYGYTICKDRDLIKDCIQDLFLDIWRRRTKLSQVEQIKYYLFSALRRLILRRLKTDEKRRIIDDPYRDISSQSPEEIRIQGESKELQKQYFSNKLKNLPERQREIIYLRYYQGLSHAEIGQIMQIKKQATWNLLSRAVKKLREIIQDPHPSVILAITLPYLLL